MVARRLGDALRGRTRRDATLELRRCDEDLGDGAATAIPDVAALATAGARTRRAQPAYEALRDDAFHRGGDLVARRADVDEARDGARGIVGVKSGEDEVSGERRLDRDLRRLAIANLPDEDDVRILAHDGAQRRTEGQ